MDQSNSESQKCGQKKRCSRVFVIIELCGRDKKKRRKNMLVLSDGQGEN